VSTTLPVVTVTVDDTTLANLIQNYPNTATDSYQGLYQLRLKTSGGAAGGTSKTWAAADILVTGTTWTQVYPTPVAPKSATTTAVQLNPASVAVGTGSTATVTVTGGDTSASGLVQLTENDTALVSGQLANGTATLQVPKTLAIGSHTLIAKYAGDDTHGASASQSVTLTVTKVTPTVKATLVAKKIKAKQHGSIKVTIVAGGQRVSGKLTVKSGAKVLVSKNAGAATTLTLPLLKKGTYKLVIVYSGSALVNARSTSALILTVTA
jgi:hypothetical protein